MNTALFKSPKSLGSVLLLMSIWDISAKIMSVNEMTDIVFQIRNSKHGSILAHSKALQISIFFFLI